MPHVYSSHLLLTGRRIPTGLQLEGKFSLTVLNGMGFLAGLQNQKLISDPRFPLHPGRAAIEPERFRSCPPENR